MRSIFGSLKSLACIASFVALAGCSGVASPDGSRPVAAQKWFERAQSGYRQGDIDDAHDSAQKALAMVPADVEVRTLAASIALARLEYAEVLRLLKDIHSTDASALRGRALWYSGELEGAADELEAMLNDAEVKDEWAKAISKLARHGAGRVPFALSGGLLASVEIVHVNPNAPLFIVPVEIDGEASLAMIATNMPEVVLDSATRPDPTWVSVRLGGRLEVHDVPATSQDLSGISKQLGAPIKALLGVNLLRHLNVTMDFEGKQFVARSFVPPPPPNATRLPLYYVKGGGMIVSSGFGGGDHGVHASLMVATSFASTVDLTEAGWAKAGVPLANLQAVKEDPSGKLKVGMIRVLRIGALDVQQVPGEYGATDLDAMEKQMKPLDIDGVMGAGLLSHYRLTMGDEGRLLWVEDDNAVQQILNGGAVIPPQGPSGVPQPPPGIPDATPPNRTPVNQALPPADKTDHPKDAPKPPPAPNDKTPGGSSSTGNSKQRSGN